MKITLAVDGSIHSEWAVDLLMKLPLAEAPQISVLHVVHQKKHIPHRRKINLVVIGSKGLTGIKRFFLESVARKVITYSNLCALIVKNTDENITPKAKVN